MPFFNDVNAIATALTSIAKSLEGIGPAVQSIATQLEILAQEANTSTVVGIGVVAGAQTTHPQGNVMQVKLLKKGQGHAPTGTPGAGGPKRFGATPITQFGLMDNGDCTFTVYGLDAAGNTVDISSVATLQVSSSDPTIVTVDAPVGMGSAMHAPTNPAPAIGATANIQCVVTWNNAANAPPGNPFNFTLPITIQAGAVSGVTIVPGTPTTH